MTDRPLAIVTGAASGIGLAFSHQLAQRGYDLVLVDLNEGPLQQAVANIATAACSAEPLAGDVSDPALWDRVLAHLGEERRPQLLVNSAGVLLGGPIQDCSADHLRRIIEVNLLGVIYGCRAVAPRLHRRTSSALPCGVISMASIFASVTPPCFTAYNASKAGVVALSETLSHEFAPRGMVATVVLPGLTSTGLFDHGSYASQKIKQDVAGYASKAELSAEDVAEQSLQAFRRKKPLVTIGRRARLYRLIQRLAPGLLRPLVRRKSERALGGNEEE